MPREIVHWEVLEGSRLSSDLLPKARELLTTYRAHAYLGALAPDVPYYHRLGNSPFTHVAEVMHGTDGEDTYEIPRRLISAVSQITDDRSRDASWAFIFGYLSHCVVDIVFHPVIYYLTGDYYEQDLKKRDRVRALHREFEVWLDSWWAHSDFGTTLLTNSVSSALVLREPNINSVFALLDQEVPAPDSITWKSGYSHLAFLQWVFTSKIIGFTAHTVDQIVGGSFRASEALFNYGRERAHEFFSLPIMFQNPMTGVEDQKSVEDLRRSALQQCVGLFNSLLEVVERNGSGDPFRGEIGRSLNSGHSCTTRAQMKYFKTPLLDLSE